MSTDVSGVSCPLPARTPNSGVYTTDSASTVRPRGLTHVDVHPRAQHGCDRCPPTPCVCGWTIGTCPEAFEHRRAYAGSETTWRVSA